MPDWPTQSPASSSPEGSDESAAEEALAPSSARRGTAAPKALLKARDAAVRAAAVAAVEEVLSPKSSVSSSADVAAVVSPGTRSPPTATQAVRSPVPAPVRSPSGSIFLPPAAMQFRQISEDFQAEEPMAVHLRRQLEELEEHQRQIQLSLTQALEFERKARADELGRCQMVSQELAQVLLEARQEQEEEMKEICERLEVHYATYEERWKAEVEALQAELQKLRQSSIAVSSPSSRPAWLSPAQKVGQDSGFAKARDLGDADLEANTMEEERADIVRYVSARIASIAETLADQACVDAEDFARTPGSAASTTSNDTAAEGKASLFGARLLPKGGRLSRGAIVLPAPTPTSDEYGRAGSLPRPLEEPDMSSPVRSLSPMSWRWLPRTAGEASLFQASMSSAGSSSAPLSSFNFSTRPLLFEKTSPKAMRRANTGPGASFRPMEPMVAGSPWENSRGLSSSSGFSSRSAVNFGPPGAASPVARSSSPGWRTPVSSPTPKTVTMPAPIRLREKM